MKILLLAIGKRHDADLVRAIDDYTERIGRYVACEWRVVDPARGKTEQAEVRRVETTSLLAELLPGDFVVVLDERGRQLESREFADGLGEQIQNTAKRAVFIIGGAYGVEQSLRERADLVWALSRLTLPHQLVRLVLAEQLYRAFTILRGEPYHHD